MDKLQQKLPEGDWLDLLMQHGHGEVSSGCLLCTVVLSVTKSDSLGLIALYACVILKAQGNGALIIMTSTTHQ